MIAGQAFRSRLILGTARYPNLQVMLDVMEASGTEIVTVAIQRVRPRADGENLAPGPGGRAAGR